MNPRIRLLVALIASAFALSTATAQDRVEIVFETPAAQPSGAAITATSGDSLVYTSVTPCRLLDTRVPSARSGPMAPDSQRDFLVFDADLDAEQGGHPDGCGLPPEVQAVAVNLVAVDPAGPGFVVAWPAGQERPLAASLNLIPGQDLANQVSIGVNNAVGELDMSLYSWAQTHVVADVVGYYAPLQLESPQCYSGGWFDPVVLEPGQLGSGSSPSCNAGFTRVEGWCDIFGMEDIKIITNSGAGGRQVCTARNTGSATREMKPTIRCCRLAGN